MNSKVKNINPISLFTVSFFFKPKRYSEQGSDGRAYALVLVMIVGVHVLVLPHFFRRYLRYRRENSCQLEDVLLVVTDDGGRRAVLITACHPEVVKKLFHFTLLVQDIPQVPSLGRHLVESLEVLPIDYLVQLVLEDDSLVTKALGTKVATRLLVESVLQSLDKAANTGVDLGYLGDLGKLLLPGI